MSQKNAGRDMERRAGRRALRGGQDGVWQSRCRETHQARRCAESGGLKAGLGVGETRRRGDRMGGAGRGRERLYSTDEAKHPRGQGPNKEVGEAITREGWRRTRFCPQCGVPSGVSALAASGGGEGPESRPASSTTGARS